MEKSHFTWTSFQGAGQNNSAAITAQQTIAQHSLEASQNSFNKSFNATINNFHLDQRAWIGIGDIRGIPEIAKPFLITVVFKNTGKTPAKRFELSVVADPVLKGNKPNFVYQANEKVASRGIVSPNGEVNITLNPTRKLGTLQQISAQLIATEQEVMYVHGRLTYKDIFAKRHWMTFCYYLHPRPDGNYEYGTCKRHNDMDNN